MSASRKSFVVIGVSALWLGCWSAWQAVVRIVDVTRWVDRVAHVLATVITALAVGVLVGGLVMLGALGASFIGHAATPRLGGSVLRGGRVVAVVCGVLAGLLSFAAR